MTKVDKAKGERAALPLPDTDGSFIHPIATEKIGDRLCHVEVSPRNNRSRCIHQFLPACITINLSLDAFSFISM